MIPKERMRRAVRHQSVDRLPTQISYTAAMGAQLAQHFEIAPEALPARLGNHLLRVDIQAPARTSPDGRLRYDWWGAGHDPHEEGYFVAVSPLRDAPDLDAFAWPDPSAPELLEAAAQAIARDGGQSFVVPNFGFALFERAWALRGLDTLLLDFATDPAYCAELLDRITAIQLVLIERFLALGVDGAYFGDDYGAQKNLLISPRMWRHLIKPRLARLFAPFRERDLPILLHSDGQIQPILPDLIEIGLTVLNPVQPEVLDHGWLRATFGARLAYYGGISTQMVLPYGTPAEVRAAVMRCVRDLAPEHTGLVLAPSHRLMSDIPLANVEALCHAFEEYA